MLKIEDGRVVYHYDAEEVWIEPWGPHALRVRATKERQMPEGDWALYRRGTDSSESRLTEKGAEIKNGKIRAEITKSGKLMIYHSDGRVLLEEYCRNRKDVLDQNAARSRLRQGNFSRFPEGIIILRCGLNL